jgi:tetratricopeptide (TPR) repeat protein
MKRLILSMCLVMTVPTPGWTGESVDVLLERAVDQLVKSGYTGDTSAAERYLQAVLEEQPDHLEATWQLMYVKLAHLTNVELQDRVSGLTAIAPAMERIERLAHKEKNIAFLHFMRATHASFYNNFERAMKDIDLALTLAPRSVRYQAARARLLVGYGKWSKHDGRIEQGISILKQAREALMERPTPYLDDAMLAFYLAGASSSLSQPRWSEVVDYYRQFIERSAPSVPYAFAWNNVSIAYKELGECAQAKDAAEQALKVMKFGAAETNKRHAELCLEMQKMGLIGLKEARTASTNAATH